MRYVLVCLHEKRERAPALFTHELVNNFTTKRIAGSVYLSFNWVENKNQINLDVFEIDQVIDVSTLL